MSTTRRRICFVTGTRADYGHLYWVMREVQQDPDLQLQVIVTGAHLCNAWGRTVDVIERDGFPIDARVDMQLSGDSGVATSKSTGLAVIGLADAYERLAPDLIVLLGDRYEELAAAQVALLMKIPVAHIHGGETSEGAMDESIRHAVTKLSHLHFVAARAYRDRVLQLGENPAAVFDFGAPGLDHLTRTPLPDRAALAAHTGLPLDAPVFAVTYHPVTLNAQDPAIAANALIGALERFPTANIVFTGVNADPGNSAIARVIREFTVVNPARARFFDSLGQQRYLSLLQNADVVIGNSSSGLIEAPALRVPTVNIGDRQRGRLKAVSVIDCADDTESIVQAVERALSPQFRAQLPADVSLYGKGHAAPQIKQVLKTCDLSNILMKKFFDFHL
ncbi:UDP-N-acetylglucosamine 2-epimerase [Paraburkholderia sp. GAS32]|uniref:UDP-N-acetylglucosamine 2-epimerase n=1 Tax=Paraburkholderia sp. GAS32 TaxID=3035129 RepID=UPI003D1D54F5